MAACTSSSPLGTLMRPALMTETSGTFFCAAQKAMALSRSPRVDERLQAPQEGLLVDVALK